MNKTDAQLLAEKITREAPGTTTVIRQQEDILVVENDSYIIDVYENGLIWMCLRTEEQWENQKHLLKGEGKNGKQQLMQNIEIQAMMRGLVIQLDQQLEENRDASQEYVKWFIKQLDRLVRLAASGETEEQLRIATETMKEAAKKLQDEKTHAEYYPIALKALRVLRAVIR